MDFKEYIKDAMRTESMSADIKRRFTTRKIRLNHAVLGLITEVGEFADGLKKNLYYGKILDKVNLEEEIGDILWYLALACNTLGSDPIEIMEKNIHKLKIRYPKAFTEKKAKKRNLKKERKILEKKIK